MKTLLLTKLTLIEFYRSHFFLFYLLQSLSLLMILFVSYNVTYHAGQKVVLDLGIGLTELIVLLVTIFVGGISFSKDKDLNFLSTLLTHDLSRMEYISGRILGQIILMSTGLLLNFILTMLAFYLAGGTFNILIFWSLGFIFLQSLILILLVNLISFFLNSTLTILLSLSVFIFSYYAFETQKIIQNQGSVVLKWILKTLTLITPNLYRFNLKDYLLYEENIDSLNLLHTSLYGFTYILLLYLLTSIIFLKKEIN
jgi:hypothetical protein